MGFQRLHQLPRHELLLRRLPPLSPYLLRRLHLPLLLLPRQLLLRRLVLAEEEGEGGSLDAVAQGRATCITGTCRCAVWRISTSLSINCPVIPPATSALAVPLE